MTIRKLYFGDNAVVMQKHVEAGAIDLVYLDPPCNSAADYNLLFKEDGLSPDEAQMHAFKDTWIWDIPTGEAWLDIQNLDNPRLIELINALKSALGQTPMMAYCLETLRRFARSPPGQQGNTRGECTA